MNQKTISQMQSTNKLTVLGSGTSTGVPTPTCTCSVCKSSHPHNKRLRTSVWLQTKRNKSLIIDTTPDLRTQVLREEITQIDGALITHAHADHIFGLDDLRPFSYSHPNKKIPVACDSQTADQLRQKFDYVFSQHKPRTGGGIPQLELKTVEGTFELAGENFSSFLLPHGHTKSLGLVHQKFAYIIDCQRVEPHHLDWLESLNLDLLIIDCLRPTPHSTHLHLERSLEYAQKIRAKQTGLIHLSHFFDHPQLLDDLKRQFGESIFPVYDGMQLEYQDHS